MSRSSIFSFESLRISSVPRHFALTLVLACATLLAAEACARWLMAPLGEHVWTYWDENAISKFEYYRIASERGDPPRIVAVGDSTGARNFDPRSFAAAAGTTSVYNLAWPANFPYALRITTLPLLSEHAAPDYVLLFQSPLSFTDEENVERFERGILSSVLGQRAQGRRVPADYLYLGRLYPARHLLAAHWLRDSPLTGRPANDGYMPLGSSGGPRAQTAGDSLPRAAIEPRLSAGRLEVVTELAEIARRRGFELIVVIAPTNRRPLPDIYAAYLAWLDEHLEALGLTVWDHSASPFLETGDFYDPIHLMTSGVHAFSSQLGILFKREFLDARDGTHTRR